MKRTGLAFLLALAVSLSACAEVANDPAEEVANDPVEEVAEEPAREVAEEPTATSIAETSTVQSDQRQRIVDDFTQGVAGTTSCAELFTLRNRLAPDDPYIDSNMNPELQRIRCFNSSSDRSDQSTTTRPQTTHDQAAFNSFMEVALDGTSYSYGRPGSLAWESSARLYEFEAESICEELADGADEATLRAATAEEEKLGDPEIDQDVPVYVDAIYAAARIYVCPDD